MSRIARTLLTTEYETSYSRRLWDESTRTNYFKLADDRKTRLYNSTNHTPIHWDLDPVKDCEFIEAERVKHEAAGTINPCVPVQAPKALSPEPPKPKVAWGSQTEKVSTEEKPSQWDKEEIYPEPTRLRPGKSKSSSRKGTPDKRIRSKLTPELPKSVSPNKNSSGYVAQVIKEEYTAPTPPIRNRSSTPSYAAQCIDDKISKPPFAMYGNATNWPGVRQTYNVKPKSNEVHSSALRAKSERERLMLYRKTIDRNNSKQYVPKSPKPPAVEFNNSHLPSTWITEYQNNYRNYAY